MYRRFLIKSAEGKRIYEAIRDLPIYDYHCHLSPREIFEDRPLDDISRIWLDHDHYKWRLMRAAGIDERLITGDADPKEKFIAYVKACELAAGSPLYSWNKMELSLILDIEDVITPENAGEIYELVNRELKAQKISPRSLIDRFSVKFIGTTDDISDSLEWHKKLSGEDLPFRVSPSFRCDRLLQIRERGYREYIDALGQVCGSAIRGIETLEDAVENRLAYFAANGCVFSDMGIPDFPSRVADRSEADRVLGKALSGEVVGAEEYDGFLGYMLVFLLRLYKKYSLVAQLHLGVLRNANPTLFDALGRDCGGDCIGSSVPVRDLVNIFNRAGDLPHVILYTLDPNATEALVSLAGCFRGVEVGAAWWFCDHRRGIIRTLDAISEAGHIGSFNGMLTDSRSFFSYARHDYFRRIFAEWVGKLVRDGEFPEEQAITLAKRVSFENVKALIEKRI